MGKNFLTTLIAAAIVIFAASIALIPYIIPYTNSPLVGSFLGVFLAFVLNWIGQAWGSTRLKFEEEYHIKAELKGFGNELRAGGRPLPIKPIYGADHVRKYRLFGENRDEVIYWYEGFQKYNFQLDDLMVRREMRRIAPSQLVNHTQLQLLAGEIKAHQDSMANQIDGMLRSDWLKRIPSSINNSGLSTAKFIWYLLKQDALEEPTTNRQFWVAALDKLFGAGVQYSPFM